MRLITMFYLMVFSSALLLSGVLNSRQGTLPVLPGEKTRSLVFSASPDSIPVSGVNASVETPRAPAITEKDEKPDEPPFLLTFSFTSILQWVFALPSRNLSLHSEPALSAQHDIWLVVRSLRI